MNKKLKVASVAVSVIMAGTMAFGMFGCGGGNGGDSSVVTPKLDENGKLTWATNTSLNINVGNQNSTAPQSIAYNAQELSGASVMPDGKTYSKDDLKPAWQAMQDQLSTASGLKLVDKFTNLSSNGQISTPVDNNRLSDYDLITGSLEEINKNSSKFLNLAEYLDYMPSYKAFLEANPVTKYSLTGDKNGGMYAAPYFDGNDDIEKYSMMNHNWVKAILDTEIEATTTFKAHANKKKENNDYKDLVVATAASAESYMGTTGSYTVETTQIGATANAETGITPTTTLKVNYDNALAQAKTEDSGLNTALKAAYAELDVTTLTSGNIVDLQNKVINGTQGEVTGAQLSKILREYIKVAYQTTSGEQFYTTLSDIFISQAAGWDVDLLVAMSRCVVTCVDKLPECQSNGNVFAISGRQQTTQRRVDLMALAGELYGVRGLESRYEYTYFDKDGKIQDTRNDESTYETLSLFSKLTKEGLVYIGNAEMGVSYDKIDADVLTDPAGEYKYTLGADGYYDADGKKKADLEGNLLDTVKYSAKTINTKASAPQTFMLHDYVQTQTKVGITEQTDLSKYNFGPVVNAISKWDVNGDGDIAADEYFRFTESWRSVKNTGFCVPASITGNTDKLSAVLALIDYLFSTDGQLLMSYGTQSTNGDTNPNGWWYATEQEGVDVSTVADKIADATNYAPAQYKMKDAYKSQYFVYKEKVYKGYAYNGTQVPELTSLNKSFYKGTSITVNNTSITQGEGNIKVSAKGDYTGYARKIIGSTLPIGNKNQGFEYQATATCGISGANTVTVALLNGTLKHVKLTLDENESPWYLIVPTALPLDSTQQNTLKNSYQTKISGTYFLNSSATTQTTNILIDMLYYGLGADVNVCGQSANGKYTTYDTGAKVVNMINDSQFQYRLGIFETGWYTINKLYKLGY